MVAIRRFIDVIFVEPKRRSYVVLHNGKFWQLPRMNLTVSAWESKEPYTGSLSDIFVAQSQAIGKQLAKTLSTYDLPEQLAGLPATHFLAWWTSNDYKWLSEKEIIKFDHQDESANSVDDELLKAALKKAQFITQNPNFAGEKVRLQLSQDDNQNKKTKTDSKVGERTPTKKKSAPQTTPNAQKTKAKPSQPKSALSPKKGKAVKTDTPAQAQTATPAPVPVVAARPSTKTVAQSANSLPATTSRFANTVIKKPSKTDQPKQTAVNPPTPPTNTKSADTTPKTVAKPVATPAPKPSPAPATTPNKQGDVFDNLLGDLMNDLNHELLGRGKS